MTLFYANILLIFPFVLSENNSTTTPESAFAILTSTSSISESTSAISESTSAITDSTLAIPESNFAVLASTSAIPESNFAEPVQTEDPALLRNIALARSHALTAEECNLKCEPGESLVRIVKRTKGKEIFRQAGLLVNRFWVLSTSFAIKTTEKDLFVRFGDNKTDFVEVTEKKYSKPFENTRNRLLLLKLAEEITNIEVVDLPENGTFDVLDNCDYYSAVDTKIKEQNPFSLECKVYQFKSTDVCFEALQTVEDEICGDKIYDITFGKKMGTPREALFAERRMSFVHCCNIYYAVYAYTDEHIVNKGQYFDVYLRLDKHMEWMVSEIGKKSGKIALSINFFLLIIILFTHIF